MAAAGYVPRFQNAGIRLPGTPLRVQYPATLAALLQTNAADCSLKFAEIQLAIGIAVYYTKNLRKRAWFQHPWNIRFYKCGNRFVA